jgi:hypothetical protein
MYTTIQHENILIENICMVNNILYQFSLFILITTAIYLFLCFFIEKNKGPTQMRLNPFNLLSVEIQYVKSNLFFNLNKKNYYKNAKPCVFRFATFKCGLDLNLDSKQLK